MAEKVLRLHPSRGFFLEAGLHLANPEKPVVILHEAYEAPKKVLRAIKSGVLIDVNQNILVEGDKVEEPKAPEKPEAPKQEEAPKEEPKQEEAEVEAKAEEKPKAKAKAKGKAKDKE